jgi:hypothetical protein
VHSFFFRLYKKSAERVLNMGRKPID